MRGVRFAPSPTGRFHIGNLRTAWVSHRLARTLGEPWVVRCEDIDTPRVVPGAREKQLEDLAALGLVPDEVVLQSGRHQRHRELFEKAASDSVIYPCSCSRREVQQALAQAASAPHDSVPAYNGACRGGLQRPAAADASLAWRFRGADPSGSGDFIVARSTSSREGFAPAYHWACAIDDFDGRYAWIVRASDLKEATPQQREIQRWLARDAGVPFAPPGVLHTALVVQDDGHRLEKRTRGVTLDEVLSRVPLPRLLAAFEASLEPVLLRRLQELHRLGPTGRVEAEARDVLPMKAWLAEVQTSR